MPWKADKTIGDNVGFLCSVKGAWVSPCRKLLPHFTTRVKWSLFHYLPSDQQKAVMFPGLIIPFLYFHQSRDIDLIAWFGLIPAYDFQNCNYQTLILSCHTSWICIRGFAGFVPGRFPAVKQLKSFWKVCSTFILSHLYKKSNPCLEVKQTTDVVYLYCVILGLWSSVVYHRFCFTNPHLVRICSQLLSSTDPLIISVSCRSKDLNGNKKSYLQLN